MKTRCVSASSLLAVVLIGAAAATSCTSTGHSPGVGDGSTTAVGSSKKTEQQVQSELMAFSDRYFALTLEGAKILESISRTPETRYTAASGRVAALVTVTDIAASPNPGAALLDMTVFVTLRRMVWEDYWMSEVYGEAGRPILDIHHELEADIWEIAAGVYTPEQLHDLRELIDGWRSQHPDVRAVDFMRLSELGDSRQAQTLLDASRPGGMLAPVKEANRELEEFRLLAERLAFMVTRLQLMVTLQIELALTKTAVQPEVRQLLEDSRVFTLATDRAAEAFAEIAADLPGERQAAIEQLLSGLSAEREQLLADLTDEDGKLRPALHDFRDTFDSGRHLAETLNEAIIGMDRLLARMMEEEPVRPFDIMDYKATVEEATKTMQELQAALITIERILGSTITDEELDSLIEGANRLEDEVVTEILNRAFIRGVALIFVFFIVLTLYRLLVRRFAPNLPPKPRADR